MVGSLIMKEALDKAVEDFKGLIAEQGDKLVQDMSDSFVQQAKEDETKKLSYSFSVGVKIVPNGNTIVVTTSLKNGIKRKLVAESVAG